MITLLRWLQQAEEIVALSIVGLIAALIGLQVVFRYLLNEPLAWTEELSQYSLICLTFVAGAAVLKRGQHYSIDAFVNLMPPAARIAAARLVSGVIVLLMLGLAYYSFQIGQIYSGTHTVVLRIPEELKTHVMIYCFLSSALHSFGELVARRPGS